MAPLPLSRNRNFVLLWVGQALSTLGQQASSIAFPLLALALTHSPAKAGVVGFANILPFPLLMLPAGILAAPTCLIGVVIDAETLDGPTRSEERRSKRPRILQGRKLKPSEHDTRLVDPGDSCRTPCPPRDECEPGRL